MLAALALLLAPPQGDGFAKRVLPVLERFCFPCHSGSEPSGELDLARHAKKARAGAPTLFWRRVRERLADGEMPPPKAPEHPSPEEVRGVIEWIDAGVPVPDPLAAGGSGADGGRVTLRRLNRDEYRHAVLDLLGVDCPTREVLPPDGVGRGFDNVGEVLSMSPILFERLFEAAERIAEAALPPGGAVRPTVRVPADGLETGEGNRYVERAGRVVLSSNGHVVARVPIARDGEYLVRVCAGEQHAGPASAQLDLAVDRARLARFEVRAPADQPLPLEARAHLAPGERVISAAFVNDYYRPEAENPDERDRNLHVLWIEVVGPVGVPLHTPFQLRFRTAERPASGVVPELARLLWRGRVAPGDVEALLALAGDEAGDEERLRTALVGLLTSPRFLFRPEPPPAEAAWRELDGFELATRLAAFLWNSVPDAELLDRAPGGGLATREARHAEVERMLLDARASRLARAFAGQWLQLGRLDTAAPDPERFPTFDEDLRAAMRAEVELFFDAMLRERRPLSELVRADFTFVDERLARHYGIAGVEGSRPRRVHVPAEIARQRGGLLGMAGLLTATSNPTRTSPVLRGKWVLEALLDTPPSPPPPGVGALDESREAVTAASLRDRLEAHRTDPSCAACHAPMDGLGFALENYDAVGAWRERDGAFPIDASGELPDGRTLEGPEGLARVLLEDGALLRGVVRQLATFAQGRGLSARDEPGLDALVAALPADPSLADVIHGIVELEGFLRRYRGEP